MVDTHATTPGTAPDRWRAMLEQLRKQRPALPLPPRQAHQPRPSGAIVPGTSTDKVLSILEVNRDRWFTRWQLCELVAPINANTVSSALLLLGERGALVTRPDTRNPRWVQYALNPKFPPIRRLQR